MSHRFTRAVAGLGAIALAVTGVAGAAVVGASTASADDTVILENDFETTFEPWGPRGPVELALTDDARTGSGALEVTGRTADWQGPAVQATDFFTPGGVYQASAWVKLPEGTEGASDLHFTVQETSAAGDNWVWVGGAVEATADEWVQIGGSYTMPSGLTAAELYIEAAPIGDEHPSFLVDDLVVTGTEGGDPGEQPDPGVVLSTDFEDGLDGWGPRESDGTAPTVEVTSDDAASGEFSARVSDRQGQGDGMGRDVSGLLSQGVLYELTAQVRFAEGQPTDSLWLSLASTDATGSTSYATLAQWSSVTNSGWSEVTVSFQAPAAVESYLYFETNYNGNNDSDFYVDDIELVVPEPAVIEDLLGVKETLPFPVGVAIDSRETSGAAAELLLRHFNQITPENHMKPDAFYTADRQFRPHPDAVAQMDFAAANDIDLYGHVLVWHAQTPDWFFEDDEGNPLTDSEADQQILRDRMRTHIFDVTEWLATDYGLFGAENPVKALDVINEVVSDGATSDGLRRSEWYRILGEEFIDLSFIYADEAMNDVYAAPGTDRPVTLFINDYNTELGGKQDRYLDLVERLLDRGVPVDGVGHQFHVSLAMPVSALKTAIERFEHLPVVQAVTELDVTTGTPETEARFIEQGYYYRDAFDLFREHADSLYSVTVWGLIDTRSWRADNGGPLLFDGAYQAKPAYFGAVDGELPAQVRSADVFAGSVELADGATEALEWSQLPLNTISSAGSDVAGFQLRWAPDHLTVYVTVTDGSVDADDAVSFDLGEATASVGRDGTTSGDVEAVVSETSDGYSLVAHLPLDGASEGDLLDFDLQVTDGDSSVGWNSPGVLGNLSLYEELSYLEVVQAEQEPTVDAEIDEVWATAGSVTTDKQIDGSGGASAEISTLWSENTLYVLAEVTDPDVDVSAANPWEQDSLEIFVDAGNFKAGAYRYDDMQVRISAENEVSFGTGDAAFQAARVDSETTLTDDGYLIEAAISLLEYGGAGTFHGLDFQLNDATDGVRTAVRSWGDPSGVSYQFTNRWGVAQLVAEEAPSAPEWEKGAVYTAGDEVTYDGALYRATWWTTETPGTSPWGSWQEIATAADGTAVWTDSRIFTAGDVVVHDGDRFEAKWWTRNQAPGDQWGPWAPLG